MNHDLVMTTAFLMQGLVTKTGGFGTPQDRANAVEAAKDLVKKCMDADAELDKYSDDLREKARRGLPVPPRPPPTSVPGGPSQS